MVWEIGPTESDSVLAINKNCNSVWSSQIVKVCYEGMENITVPLNKKSNFDLR